MLKKLSVVAFLLFAVTMVGSAQTSTVNGKVIDAKTKQSLPGANVYLLEIRKGGTTDIDGNYLIQNVEPGTYTLVASYLGYVQFKEAITIGSASVTKNISLEPDLLGLDVAVVTGTGTATSKRKLGISVESVSNEALTQAPAMSLDAALAGKVAGATITQVSGQPGRSASILLRGINTLGSTTPMIMIDGVQVNTDETFTGAGNASSRLADISFDDIERVEVVKGAAASTIYGAQGANGVIQIFTKKGQAGKPRVSYSASYGFNNFTSEWEVPKYHFYQTNADGTIAGLVKNASGQWVVPGVPVLTRDTQVNKPYVEPTFNAVDAVFRTSTVQQHNISVSGGDRVTTYLLSANIQNQEGIERNTYNDRLSVRLNTASNITDNFRIEARTNFINVKNRGTISGGNITSPLSNALFNLPFIDMNAKDANGRPIATLIEADNSVNPLFQWDVRNPTAENIRFINSLNFNYNPFSFLELDYKFGLDHYRFDFREIQSNFQDVAIARLTPREGYNSQFSDKSTTINSIASAFIRLEMAGVQSQTHLAFDARREIFNRVTTYGQGLPPFSATQTLRSTSTPTVNEFQSEFATYGFLINQKFDYGELAGLSLGGRMDYSSAFGSGVDPAFFPRADAYFRVSELEFMGGTRDYISDLKVRAAYGEAGVQPGAFSRIVTLGQNVIGQEGVLQSRTSLPNVNLLVEKSSEFEYGMDVTFLTKKDFFSTINANLTFWNRSSDDVIYVLDVAPSTGAQTVNNNSIAIGSQGVDLSISTITMSNSKVNWLTTLNIGRAVSTVDRIANGEDIVVANDYLLREGSRVGVHFGFRALRKLDEVNPATGNHLLDQTLVAAGRYGFVDGRVVDLQTRQVMFRPYQEQIGDPTPDFVLGFRNDVTLFGNMNIAVQWDWVKGVELYNRTRQWLYRDWNHADLGQKIKMPGWDPVGGALTGTMDEGAFASYYQSIYKTNDKNEFFVEDGSFIRLRELAISYDIASLLPTKSIRSFKVGFAGRNLLTFTNYKGFDPEVSANGADSRIRGLDEFTYPNFKTYTFTTSISF